MTSSHTLTTALLTELAHTTDVSAAPTLEPALAPPDPIGPPITVGPSGAPRQHDLAEVLRRRRSTRWFGPGSIDAATIADVVDHGLVDRTLEVPTEVTVVAFRLIGLPPAVYQYDAGTRVMTPVMAIPDGERRADLTMQPEFSDAAAIISLGLPLQQATSTAHDYRRAISAMGDTAYSMWLAAIARDLVGTVFAGFLPAAIRRPLLSDGTHRHQAFALALGAHAPTPIQEDRSGTPLSGEPAGHHQKSTTTKGDLS